MRDKTECKSATNIYRWGDGSISRETEITRQPADMWPELADEDGEAFVPSRISAEADIRPDASTSYLNIYVEGPRPGRKRGSHSQEWTWDGHWWERGRDPLSYEWLIAELQQTGVASELLGSPEAN